MLRVGIDFLGPSHAWGVSTKAQPFLWHPQLKGGLGDRSGMILYISAAFGSETVHTRTKVSFPHSGHFYYRKCAEWEGNLYSTDK